MLQHNASKVGRRAHVMHAAMIAIHALCCGIPVIALAAAGASSTFAGLSVVAGGVHGALHAREIWLLGVSAALVAIGGAFEWRARTSNTGIPVLFAISLGCFALNLLIVASHRLPATAGL